MNITIKTIPHKRQKYPTLGNYWEDKNGIQIRVSEELGEDYAFLVSLHEMVEQYLCKKRGIKEKDITNFDKDFESKRGNEMILGKKGMIIRKEIDEPGDDPKSPYWKEHCFATGIERLMCAELGLSWKEYEEKCNSL